MKLADYIGEATAYDKKLMLERKDPISWLKSVSAFANTQGGKLLYGVSDSGELIGLERRGSGFKKILNAYQFESEKRGHEFVPTFRSTGSSFFVILPNLNYGIKINGVQQETSQVTTEVTTQVTTEVKRLVIALIGEMRSDALMASIGIKQKEDFRTRYLKPAIVNGFVEMTQPDSPRSPTQKYRLTEKGVVLAKQQEDER